MRKRHYTRLIGQCQSNLFSAKINSEPTHSYQRIPRGFRWCDSWKKSSNYLRTLREKSALECSFLYSCSHQESNSTSSVQVVAIFYKIAGNLFDSCNAFLQKAATGRSKNNTPKKGVLFCVFIQRSSNIFPVSNLTRNARSAW